MTDQHWAFLGISVLVIVTPGPDTALTIRNALLGGRMAGVATAIGVALGQAIWALGTSLGVIGLLLASSSAFHLIKLVGAAYLIFLGAQSIWAALRRSAGSAPTVIRGRRLQPAPALRQGIVSNLGNPKMAVFFASLLPQFAPPHDLGGLLGLGLLFCGMTLVWLSLYAAAIARASDLLLRAGVKRTLEVVSGAALLALGIGLASEKR
jgi:threonine/homoserine/homoserine lactone efflux protein